TYDSSLIASQYSSEEVKKEEVYLKHFEKKSPDLVWEYFFATSLKSSIYFSAKYKYYSILFNCRRSN
ncbi:11784_t:CDS:1, partial [Dentiscutata erythropus]